MSLCRRRTARPLRERRGRNQEKSSAEMGNFFLVVRLRREEVVCISATEGAVHQRLHAGLHGFHALISAESRVLAQRLLWCFRRSAVCGIVRWTPTCLLQ